MGGHDTGKSTGGGGGGAGVGHTMQREDFLDHRDTKPGF